MNDSLAKLNIFKNILEIAWVKKTMGGVFKMEETRYKRGMIFSFSLPNSIKIDGTYPSRLEIWTSMDNEYVYRVDGLIVGDVRTNGEEEENFIFKFYPKGDLYNLLRKYDFEEDDVHHFVFPLKVNPLGGLEQEVSVVQEIDRSCIKVRQYWSLISIKRSDEFKSLFPKIDISKNEKELEILANDMVEWLYNYMTIDGPKKFKEELKKALDITFNIIKEKLRGD